MHEDPTLPLSAEQLASPDLALARDRWGPFKLLARVGHGGFGEVYRAWDPSLEREVALKLLLPGPAGTQQTDHEYKAMLREARALAAIQHPNIVHVYGIDRHDNRVGFWTDFVKGRTLSSLLATQGPFGYREAALITLDITRALSAVHRANMLHRDIKPGNVMREEGGRILLMDFGLSTLPQMQSQLETSVAGTPNYMAPELWRGQPATVQTDIYAIGVMLFHLVTGETPVKLNGLTPGEAVAALGRSIPLMDLRSDLPESFLNTVSKALEADPAKRFATAGQLAAALAECLGTSAPSEVLANLTTAEAGVVKPRNRLFLGIAIAAVVLASIAWKSSTVKRMLHLQSDPEIAAMPADVSDEYLKAQDLLQHSYKDANLAAAVTGFQSVLAKDPTNALAYAGLGTAYFQQYRNSSDPTLLDQARVAINKALQLDPNLAPAYATLARMESMAGHTDLAIQQAQKAIRLDPRNPEAQAALAEVYDDQGKYTDASDAIQKAIDLAPEDSTLVVHLGNYLLDNSKSKKAAEAFQRAVNLDGQNIYALYDLGVVEMRSDQLEAARSNFQKVLQIQPDAYSYKSLATIALLQGKYGDAVAMDKKALSLDPQSYQAWGNLAGAYAWSGDRTNASESYKKAIEIAKSQSTKKPNDVLLTADMANFYASIGDTADSLPLIRKALALSPNDSQVSYIVGEGYELLGQREQAIPLISKAIALGYQPALFQRSPEMASLRADPAFQSALAEAKANTAVDTAK